MGIKTWEDAETAATEFAELTSQLEILKEQLREFCERRHDAVGRERMLGPIIVGFRKESAALMVGDEALAIAAIEQTRGLADMVKTVKELDRPRLKQYLLASAGNASWLLTLKVYLRAATEKFYVKLARNEKAE